MANPKPVRGRGVDLLQSHVGNSGPLPPYCQHGKFLYSCWCERARLGNEARARLVTTRTCPHDTGDPNFEIND